MLLLKIAMLNVDKEIEGVKIILKESGACYYTSKFKAGEQTLSMYVDVDDKLYLRAPQEVTLCCITNDALYKMIIETLDDDKKLISKPGENE